jgi:hypothetical protein
MKVTISASKIDADLTNFPVMILLNSTNIDWTHVQDDLDDLRFIDSTETIQLYAELENYTVNTNAWIWVKIPTVDDTVDTDFYIYYGNSGVSSWWSPEDVWDSSAVMVQHMYDNPDTSHIMDSTSYSNDGTKKGADEPIETASGKIDSALSFDGNNDLITIPSATSLQGMAKLTISTWIKISELAHWNTIIYKVTNDSTDYALYFTQINSYNSFRFGIWTTVGTYILTDAINHSEFLNTWVHFAAVYDGSLMTIYINGSLQATTLAATGTIKTSTQNLVIGEDINYDRNFAGVIDEVRVYNRALSAAEIKADYYSGSNSLLSYGAESYVSYALTVRYNIGINKLYINGTQRANNTTIYIPFNSNVNATAVSQSNFIFSKHILGMTETSFTPEYTFSMIKPYVLWSYALPNFYIYEEPTTFTFSQWMMLLFLALGISLLAAIKFHIIATVSLILVLYMIINVASYTGMILLAIIVWLLTIMFSIIAFGEI